MKNRVWAIVLTIIVLAAFAPVPRAQAEPLTIMAIVGVAAVLSVSTVDIVASRYEDNRDQRAQEEATEKMLARSDAAETAPGSGRTAVAARQD
jgi:hypothetical protein